VNSLSSDIIHEFGSQEEWNESFYFNFYDRGQDICGFMRIGLKPSKKLKDVFCFLMLPDGSVMGIKDSVAMEDNELEAKGLKLAKVEDEKKWHLEFSGELPKMHKDAEKEPVETLWFLGDYAAYHPSSARVSRMVALVFQAMGLDFGCLLKSERSAGNDVRRAGEEGLFEMLAEQNVQALGKAQFRRIVTTDPHTYHTLKHDYRRFGLDKPVYHYSELLDEAIRQGRLSLKQKLEGTAVLHDACYLGRYNGIYDPPRRVLDALGLKRLEMPRSREHSFCCGAGGGKIWMGEDEAVKERPAVNRIREALAISGVTHFVVVCPKDLGMFEDAVKTVGQEDRLKVVDLGELVFEAI